MMEHSGPHVRWPGSPEPLWAITAIVILLSGAVSPPMGVHAQTIDSRDTRTFQDNQVQDTRQSPVPVSPDEAARLKRLAEEAAAEQSDPRKDSGEKKKSEVVPPEHSPSPRPK